MSSRLTQFRVRFPAVFPTLILASLFLSPVASHADQGLVLTNPAPGVVSSNGNHLFIRHQETTGPERTNTLSVSILGTGNGGYGAPWRSASPLAARIAPGTLSQVGTDNHMALEIRGQSNQVAMAQSGSGNIASAVMAGNLNSAVILQTGSGNIAAVRQTGNRNTVTISQGTW